MVLFLRGKGWGWGMCVQGPPGGPPSLLPRVRFFKKIQIRILESKNGFCVSLIKSENGF